MSINMQSAKIRVRGPAVRGNARMARRGVACLALMLAGTLAGCANNRPLPPPVVAHDYRDRHPVVLAETPYVLDVFPSVSTGKVDIATEGRIREFVAHYNEVGTGQVSVLTPTGGTHNTGVNLVRRALSTAGLRGNILVGTYPVTDPALAAPVRLSFTGIKAKVPHRCGEWPADLASGTSLDGWNNQSYWNFGCASQSTLNAQLADPRDLAAPRGETAADIEMRMRGINRVRRGEDPVTNWKLKASTISNVGGQ